MKNSSLQEHPLRQRGELLAFLGLGFAGLVTILFAIAAIADLEAGSDPVASTLSAPIMGSNARAATADLARAAVPVTNPAVDSVTPAVSTGDPCRGEQPLHISNSPGQAQATDWFVKF